MPESQFFYEGPWTPFQGPLTPPEALFTDAPHVSLCFNHDWLPFVVTALKVLLRPETWLGDLADLQTMREDLFTAIADFEEGCVRDIQFRNPTECTLEVSLDGGVSWTQIFDAMACINARLADGTLAPGSTAATTHSTPPTECRTIKYIVQGKETVPLAALVNAGDTIHVTDGGGAWTDGLLFSDIYCVDGTVFGFPTGCGAGEPAHSGDPFDEANHMELILSIAGTYYRIMSGDTITVPAGVINAQAVLLPNDSVLNDNGGSVFATIEHCAFGWEHIFDFTVDNGSFEVTPTFQGTYVSSTGWETEFVSGGGGQEQFVIRRAVTGSQSILQILAEIDAPALGATATSITYWTGSGFTTDLGSQDITLTGEHEYSTLLTGTLTGYLTLVLNGYTFASHSAMTLKKLTVRGTGADPF